MSDALKDVLDEEHLEKISSSNFRPDVGNSFVAYSKSKNLLTITASENFIKELISQEDLVFSKDFFGIRFSLSNDELDISKNSDGEFLITLRVISTEAEDI
jgi:hypothetical protein